MLTFLILNVHAGKNRLVHAGTRLGCRDTTALFSEYRIQRFPVVSNRVRAEFSGINRIAHIVPQSVGHISNQVGILCGITDVSRT